MTTRRISRLWEQRVVPRLVEISLRGDDIGELRTGACTGLSGRVLELGYGSGLNTRHYPEAVTAIDAVEPSDLAWQIGARRREVSSVPVHRVGLDGEALAAGDASYDHVLSTFTLCTIPDVAGALREVRRVLRPGGVLHFLEHGRAPTSATARWQRRLEPVQRRVAGGCHLTRDIATLVEDARMEIATLRAEFLPGPAVGRPWTFVYLGTAVAA